LNNEIVIKEKSGKLNKQELRRRHSPTHQTQMNDRTSPSEAFELIKWAIAEKKVVSAVYHERRRELCPHVLGWKAEREHALFFQVGGDSVKGLAVAGSWRCLNLDELSDVATQDGDFRTGPGYYDNPQKCVDKIEAQIPWLKVVAKRTAV
jgi:hypothetical protein